MNKQIDFYTILCPTMTSEITKKWPKTSNYTDLGRPLFFELFSFSWRDLIFLFFIDLKNNIIFHVFLCFGDAFGGGFSNPWIFKNERFV